MREIKFRGKRLGSGEWVYGDLHTTHGIDENGTAYTRYEIRGYKPNFGPVYFTVDGNTIGQYIGLKDYNDKEIYEGDILKASALNLPDIVKVGFKWGSFVLVDKHGEIIGSLWDYDPDAFEVIGNIHDDPEMMKTVDD